MLTFLDTLEKLGIFTELNPTNPEAIRQLFEQRLENGELTSRHDATGNYFAKFYNEPTEFRVKAGVFLYNVDTGIIHNPDWD